MKHVSLVALSGMNADIYKHIKILEIPLKRYF
jgi:hypothetical protein